MDIHEALALLQEFEEERSHLRGPLGLVRTMLSFQSGAEGEIEQLPAHEALARDRSQAIKDLLLHLLEALSKGMNGAEGLGDEAARVQRCLKRRDVIRRIIVAVHQQDRSYIQKRADALNVSLFFLNVLGYTLLPVLLSRGSSYSTETGRGRKGLRCPFCGSPPQLGFLSREKEGARFMVCPACLCTWPVSRDICPLCGTEHKDLTYFFCPDGTHPGVRAYTCSMGKEYFKVIDERDLPERPFFPLIEDAASLDFDLVLERQGLSRYAAGPFWLPQG